MSTKNRKKRRRPSRSNKPQDSDPFRPGGDLVLVAWAVVLLDLAATYFSYQYQMNHQNYAHIPVDWLIVGAVLLAMAIGVTVQWHGSKTEKSGKDKRR